MARRCALELLAVGATAAATAAAVELSMPSHFSDGMVLQTWNKNHMAAKLYGLARPGELVNATTDQSGWPWLATAADADGRWSVAFNLPPGAGTAGFTLTVTGNESSTSPLVFRNVKWGDVYACVGDSSVLLPVSASAGGPAWLASKPIQTLLDNKNLMLWAGNAAQAASPQPDFTPGTDCAWPGAGSPSSLPCNAWVQATNASASAFSSLCLQTVASLLTLPGGNPGNGIVGVVQLAANYTPIQSLLPPWANTSSCPPLATDPSPPPGIPSPALPSPSSLYNGLVSPIAEQTWRGYLLSTAGSDWNAVAASPPGAYACALAALRDALGLPAAVGDVPLLLPLAGPAVAAGGDGDALFAFQREQQGVLPHSGGPVTTSVTAVTSDAGTASLAPTGADGKAVGPAAPTNTLVAAERIVLPVDYMAFWNFARKGKGPWPVSASASSSSPTTVLTFAFAPDGNLSLPFLSLVPAPGCTLCCGGLAPSAVFQVAQSASGPVWTNATFALGAGNATVLVTTTSSGSASGAAAFVRYGAADPSAPECFLVDNTTGLLAEPFLLPVLPAAATAAAAAAAPAPAPGKTTAGKTAAAPGGGAPLPSLPSLPVPDSLLSSAHLIAEDGSFSRRAYLLHGRERARAFADRIARGLSPFPAAAGGGGAGAIISPTPPLGYNSWQAARCNLDEVVLLRVGQGLVSSGLAALGFNTVNTDDCVMRSRLPSNASLVEDETRFPSTIFNLVAGLKALGLGFGIYTSQTSSTCTGRPASYEMEDVDAARWCEWGVGFVKVDNCGGQRYPAMNTSWIRIREGLAAHCGADNSIVLSVETCGDPRPSECGGWIRSVGAQMWRTTDDLQLYWSSVLSNLDGNEKMAPLAGPGRYNDPDMLILGHAGLTLDEARSHLSGWVISAAPLLLSFDVDNPSLLTPDLLALLSNPEVLAVDQDPAVVQGVRMTPPNATGTEVWAKPLVASGGNATAVFAFNRANGPEDSADIFVDFSECAPGLFPPDGPAPSARVRDLWAREDLGVFQGGYVVKGVRPHASAMLLITPA